MDVDQDTQSDNGLWCSDGVSQSLQRCQALQLKLQLKQLLQLQQMMQPHPRILGVTSSDMLYKDCSLTAG